MILRLSPAHHLVNTHHSNSTSPTMDFVKNAMGGGNNNNNAGENQQSGSEQQSGGGGFLGGIGNKLNNAAGGGEAGEKKEDYLDKGMQAYFDFQAPQ